MKKILCKIFKFGLYLILLFLIILTIKFFIPVERINLEYPNQGRWSEHNRADFISAEECGICHQDIYNQWKTSGMANATNSSLVEFDLHRLALSIRGHSEEDVEWCYQCHAPLALTQPIDLALKDPVSKSGVTCMVCHTTVHAIPDSNAGNFHVNPSLIMNGPFDDAISNFHQTNQHKLYIDDNSDLCSSCHYSVYPKNNMPIDWTWNEWHESNSDKSCKQCHMPEYIGKSANRDWVPERKLRKHTFPGGGKYNPDFIKTSASISSQIDKDSKTIKISITNHCGHNFPTGNGSAPVLELKITDNKNKSEIYSEYYKNSYIGHLGLEVMDPTLALEKGIDTSLPAYSTIQREININEFSNIDSMKVELIFHYWLPFEEKQQLKYGLKTLINYLVHPEVDIVTVLNTLRKKETWKTLQKLTKVKPKPVYIVDSQIISIKD